MAECGESGGGVSTGNVAAASDARPRTTIGEPGNGGGPQLASSSNADMVREPRRVRIVGREKSETVRGAEKR